MSPNDDLWQRLEAFELDVEGASLPFCARLVRDNCWSPDFASRVALEYKKFLYLACTAGHPVTPSDEVDQAWHLHLTYSRSYWDELCAKVLERPLHHDPTRGGKSEGQKFENWYQRTLDSYRAAFGDEPPADIWPPSHIRFGEASHFRRVNLKRCWVLPRPQFPKVNRQATFKVASAVILLFALAGCSRSSSLNPFDWYGDEFLALFWTLCFMAAAFSLWMRFQPAQPTDANFPATIPDPYVLARLANSDTLPVDAALATFHDQGMVQIRPNGVITCFRAATPSHPFEREVWNTINGSSKLNDVRRKLRNSVERFDAELLRLGLVIAAENKRQMIDWPFKISMVLVGFGILKIAVGLSRNRPVEILVLFTLVLLAIALALRFVSPLRTSQRGDLYLKKLRSDYLNGRPIVGTSSQGTPLLGTEIAFIMALWGYSRLPAPLRDILRPPGSSGDSGGSDGGDSGCGGSGCGGCGGGD